VRWRWWPDRPGIASFDAGPGCDRNACADSVPNSDTIADAITHDGADINATDSRTDARARARHLQRRCRPCECHGAMQRRLME
jgi:hypothetical protein